LKKVHQHPRTRARRPSSFGAVWALGAAIFALGAGHPAGAAPIQLTLRPYANTVLRTVEVTVNGHEMPFIFDTGAGITILTPAAARYAGCTPDRGFRFVAERLDCAARSYSTEYPRASRQALSARR
jgi:hypothetical protein